MFPSCSSSLSAPVPLCIGARLQPLCIIAMAPTPSLFASLSRSSLPPGGGGLQAGPQPPPPPQDPPTHTGGEQ